MSFLVELVKTGVILFHDLFEDDRRLFWSHVLLETCSKFMELYTVKKIHDLWADSLGDMHVQSGNKLTVSNWEREFWTLKCCFTFKPDFDHDMGCFLKSV